MRRPTWPVVAVLASVSAACADGTGILAPIGTAGSVTVSVLADSLPVPGVRVDMSGPESRTATTGTSGAVTFGGLANGTYTATISGYASTLSFPATVDTVIVADQGPAQTVTFLGADLGND